jgi:hypothetical protein
VSLGSNAAAERGSGTEGAAFGGASSLANGAESREAAQSSALSSPLKVRSSTAEL